MFACILILILFLPAALLPCTLIMFFSSSGLNEMGIRLEEREITELLPDANIPCRSLTPCI